MRFAFKGRCSTEDQQDPESSRGWQLARARALIEPQGSVIVAEYFDSGHSRSVPWQRRPQASRLLEELKKPIRAFDAVVIGEPQREFYGNQFGNTFPLFVHFDVPLWVPEVGGPIDPNNEAHDPVPCSKRSATIAIRPWSPAGSHRPKPNAQRLPRG